MNAQIQELHDECQGLIDAIKASGSPYPPNVATELDALSAQMGKCLGDIPQANRGAILRKLTDIRAFLKYLLNELLELKESAEREARFRSHERNLRAAREDLKKKLEPLKEPSAGPALGGMSP